MRLRPASLILALALAAAAVSQTLRQGVAMDIASTPLLGDSTIQTHLKLSADQKTKIVSAFKGYGEWVKSQKRPANATEGAALQKKARDLQMKTGREALAILSATQRTRLRQLGLQLYGPFTFFAPDVKAELKITPQQTKTMSGIQTAFQNVVRSLEKRRNDELNKIPKPKDRNDQAAVKAYVEKAQAMVQKFGPGDQKTLAEAKRKAEGQLVAVLTPDQRKRWAQMLGAKYNFVNQGRRGR